MQRIFTMDPIWVKNRPKYRKHHHKTSFTLKKFCYIPLCVIKAKTTREKYNSRH